jgi:excisionase family DNA binding protein
MNLPALYSYTGQKKKIREIKMENILCGDRLMTVEDVAKFTRLQSATIRRYVCIDKIPSIKVGGAIRFWPQEIERWLNGGTADKTEV